MEILIVGLIVVALMVYASTRIKRNAAAAFESETIETDEFVIKKPEGFLHNLNGDPAFIFETYSKGFSEEQPKMRSGTASITKRDDIGLDALAAERLLIEGVSDQGVGSIGGYPYRLLGSHQEAGDNKTEVFYKLIGKGPVVYELKVTAIDEAVGGPWAETFIDSFRVK